MVKVAAVVTFSNLESSRMLVLARAFPSGQPLQAQLTPARSPIHPQTVVHLFP